MKRLLRVAFLIVMPLAAEVQDRALIERGRALFSDKSLSGNGQCSANEKRDLVEFLKAL